VDKPGGFYRTRLQVCGFLLHLPHHLDRVAVCRPGSDDDKWQSLIAHAGEGALWKMVWQFGVSTMNARGLVDEIKSPQLAN